MLVVEAALFAVAAGHGLDLTDEGFYLLTYRHWTEAPAVSLFGAYFSIPFAVVSHDVWAIRVLGFALLLGAGIWFGYEANRVFVAHPAEPSRDGLLVAAVASGAAIWSYYGVVVPYTPSYNLLTLVCALLVLALALRLGRIVVLDKRRTRYGTAFALGLIGSAGIASKFSAGILVLALGLVIVCVLAWRQLDTKTWFRMALALAAGLLLNLVMLWLADPGLPTGFQRGIAVALAMHPRNPSGELARFVLVELPVELAVSLRILLWPIVFAILALAVGARISRPPLAHAVAIAFLVIGALLDTFLKDNRIHRIVLLTLFAILLALASLRVAPKMARSLARWQMLLVACAIGCVPFAYSFGTNNALLPHMGAASIFPSVLAIAQVRALWVERAIPTWVFATGMLLLAALPAEIVVRQWIDGNYTYRLGAPLSAQTSRMPRNEGEVDLRVTPSMARGLDDYLHLVRESGFVAGQPMIDFTGQGPGLVALSGGVPLGTIWIVGGPTFDGEQMARASFATVDRRELRRAWLLTSSDSFARIASWATILQELGAFDHEQVGRVTVSDPTSDDKTKTIEVTLWRPRR